MITSTSNAKVKRLVNLKKKKKLRDEEGVFLVEGIRMFREVPLDKLKEVYVSESFYKKEKDTVKEVLKDSKVRVEELTDTVFAHASDTKTPQGILCVVEQMNHEINELTSAKCPLIMVLDHLQDPGNLGTIIRIADWFGIEHIFCSPDTADLYNPKTVQATMGAMARVCAHYLSLTDLLRTANADIPVYGTFLDGNDMYGTELSPNGLIVMGNEGKGISRDVASLINRKLYIPNYPPERNTSESLNVAVATAIVCAEFRRRDTIGRQE